MSLEARVDATAIDALFAPFDRSDAPGFAVGIALKGLPQYRRGFGSANIELPVTLSPGIRMRIGSTTKHFCVLAAMLLAEDGKLSIDDSPRRFLPELPSWADAMTIRQFMSHTSGMRDSLDLLLHSAGAGKAASPDFQSKLLAALDSVNFAPGTSWSYNNGGYVLLTEIIERVSGLSLEEVLRTRILEPVGMYDTMLRRLDTDLVPNSATLHVPSPAGGYMRGVFGAPVAGEGGMVSTVDDMLLWLKHMSAPVVGSAETWKQMRTPHATHGYGLGLTMGSYRGLDTVHHAGAVVGGSSQMLKVLGHELDIILMTNGRSGLDVYNLVDAIIDACIPDLPPKLEPATDAPVSGTFYSANTGRTFSLVEHEGKQLAGVGPMTLPTYREADGRLSVAILPSDMRLKVSQDEIVLTEFGNVDTLTRIVPDPAPAPVEGQYENAAAGITATIADKDGKPELTMAGPLGELVYTLASIGPALWCAVAIGLMPLRATLEMDEAGFRFTTGRTTRLRFERIA